MRAVRVIDGAPRVVDVDEPVDGAGVLVDIASTSFCGSDSGYVAAGFEGFTLGHEFAGYVDGVPYAIEPVLHCGECAECLAGHTQRCTNGRQNLGLFADGGLAERIRVPTYTLASLPAGLDAADASLVEPTSVSLRGVRRSSIEPGERVVVVGAGSIGLLAVAVVHALGHEVALEARHPHQHEAGERLGATTQSGEYDVVIEAAGSESGVARAAELARPGGRVMLLGVYPTLVPVPGVPTIVKELSWLSSMACGRHGDVREFEEAAALLAANPDIAATLITHRFPLDDARGSVPRRRRPRVRCDQGRARTLTAQITRAEERRSARKRSTCAKTVGSVFRSEWPRHVVSLFTAPVSSAFAFGTIVVSHGDHHVA